MAVSAKEVNELRKMTGAGMMDCKNALVEANGDFDAAMSILRKSGQKISAKRADKDANEGIVFAGTIESGSQGFIFCMKCETDFVAKNEEFQVLGKDILSEVLDKKPENLEGLMALNLAEGQTVEEKITDLMGKIGEKIQISNYYKLDGDRIVPYIHLGSKLGVLVSLKGVNGTDVLDAGRDVAMQIAAMNPLAVDKDSVDQDLIKKELEIGKEQARAAGKPEEMLEKIALGKLNKYFKENTLLNQSFVKDPSLNVQKYLESICSGLTVSDFKRVSIGE
jgi:elongation factor Ts